MKYSNLASRLPMMAENDCPDLLCGLEQLLMIVTFFHTLLDAYQDTVMGLLTGIIALRDTIYPGCCDSQQ